ncbi:Cro/CI family transcriptional regulator [Pseudomonas sp. TMW 2.1634]|uniref:Cro/CI family transcriptional regulator n=1 Tax=Pseudomonas sp. TMW 2.1634 TaxID=1886807 RepID=UPI000E726591|nr:Cro/CI family transcriptional regulator [Pseudomonas sp. TMW 2.1634]AOA05663.1 Cro/Cl family transcriptional regulator [Pseudomonas sp. TMW 2.1634]
MKETSLDEFVTEKGQSEAARLLGVTPPAIYKAIAAGRHIRVIELPDGVFQASELRPFPSQPTKLQVA